MKLRDILYVLVFPFHFLFLHNAADSKYNQFIFLQVVVGPEGQIGCSCEHATAEGPPILALLEYCLPFV